MATRTQKTEWRETLAQERYNKQSNIMYWENGRMKTINSDSQVIDFGTIRNEVVKMWKKFRPAKMTAKSFIRRLTRRLKISGWALGRICEARLFKLYMRFFYLAVERKVYYPERERSSFYYHLYLAA